MNTAFSDDPHTPGARIWSRSGWAAVGSGIVFALFIVMLLGTLTLTRLMFSSGMLHGMGERVVGTIGCAIFFLAMAALARLVWRDMLGKRSASIRLGTHGITLHLRAGRSLIHPTPSCDETVVWRDVKAIETRLEAYGAQGGTNMQRAYRLTRRDAAPIFLFEERALGSTLESASMHAMATELAQRAELPLTDLGMVRGRGGLLGAWFTAPAPWDAASLTEPEQSRQWHRVALTASAVGLAFGVIWVVQVLVSVL
jgi:hypothetical protein